MAIKIIPATIKDLKKIRQLNLKLFQNEFNNYDHTLDCSWPMDERGEKYFKSRIIDKGNCVFLAKQGNNIIGYLAGGLSKVSKCRNIKDAIAELENMYIEDKYRGKGIGSMLINAFLKWCKINKCVMIRVVASFDNTMGVNFYKNNGFVPFEIILEKDI